jgi:hypothetical protein
MAGTPGVNGPLNSQSLFSRKRSKSRIVAIHCWMPSEIHEVSFERDSTEVHDGGTVLGAVSLKLI